jgi:tetratricopeptide (TPR) repeat protein
MAVAGEYRCPVCAGESVAASDAPEAVQIKNLISEWLGQGVSQARIRTDLVGDYGLSILEKPPATGLSVLVWVLPGLAVLAGLAVLGAGFARWRRTAGQGPPIAVGAGAPVPVSSVPVSSADRLRTVDHGSRPWWSSRASLVVGTVLVLVAGALLVLDRSSSPALPGGTITGGPSGVVAELQDASSLASADPAAALALYDKVLASDPGQPEALTDEGWIYAQAGFVSKAMALLSKAEKVSPRYSPAHFYRGLVLLKDERRPAAARAELQWYLAHGPAQPLVAVAKKALAAAGA